MLQGMRVLPGSLALLVITTGCAARQKTPTPPPPEVVERLAVICSTTPCRPIRGGPPVPYVFNDAVSVYPGEKFAFTGEVKEGRLVDLRHVALDAPGPKLVVDFTSSDSAANLAVDNSFDVILKYRAGMVVTGDSRPRGTSSCPVVAGGGAYEMWPHGIDVLLLDSFRVLPPSGQAVCD